MRTFVRSLALGAGCVAVAAGLAGCGDDNTSKSSDSTDAGTISLAAYRKAADPLCDEASSAMAETELPSSFPAQLDDYDKGSKAILAAIEEPYTKLAKLDAPKGEEARAQRFATALRAAVDDGKQIRRLVAAQNDDTDALGLAKTNVVTHTGTAMNEAEGLGLDACTQLNFKQGGH